MRRIWTIVGPQPPIIARRITVRHLLNLTSGRGSCEGTPYREGQDPAGVDAGPEPVVR